MVKFKYKIPKAQLKAVEKRFQSMKSPLPVSAAKRMGAEVVKAIRANLARGASAIRGMGKMPKYRGEYHKQIRKRGYVYSGGRKYNKRLRPVNLKVSGEFWRALKYKITKEGLGYAIRIGFYDKQSMKKEEGHRDGARGQAERPVIPIKGERFAKPIENTYLRIFEDAVKKLSRK